MKQIRFTDFELIRFYIMTWAFTFYIFGISGKFFGKQIDNCLLDIDIFYFKSSNSVYVELNLFYCHIFTKNIKL